MAARGINLEENRRRRDAGEMFYAFTTDLVSDRRKCILACKKYNEACGEVTRRRLVGLWKELNGDLNPIPPPPDPSTFPTKEDLEDADEELLKDCPWVDGPIRMDYGYNVRLGKGVYVNVNSVWIDTCLITIGDRTMIGPNCSFYSGTHPLNPAIRNGTNGPEFGKPITIGEDCWIGGNSVILAGVTIGRGSTVGAGSVVTKNVAELVCVAGNPARVIKTVQ